MNKWRLFFCFFLISANLLLSAGEPSAPVDPPTQNLLPEPVPAVDEMTDPYKTAFGKMLTTLGMLVVVLIGTMWVLKRLKKSKFRSGNSQHISIVERRALSPKTVLYCLKVGEKEILISESQLEVRALATLTEEIHSPEPEGRLKEDHPVS